MFLQALSEITYMSTVTVLTPDEPGESYDEDAFISKSHIEN